MANDPDRALADAEDLIVELKAREARLRAALMEIKRNQGKVCTGYELCTHESCRSSYISWAIADAALTDPTGQRVDPDCAKWDQS